MTLDHPNSSAARDRAYALHPFVDPLANVEPLVVTGGKGIRVTNEEGRSFIDAMSGLWCASLGFDNERLARVAYEQMRKLPFYHAFTGKTHLPMIDLCERLVALAPVPMSKVFLANSGSEANDTAIKLIWYFNNALGRPEKKKIIGRVRGYHGITLATASVTGMPINHRSFDVPLDRFHHVRTPHYYHEAAEGESEEDFATRCAEELEQLILREGPETVAAMFMEPVMGGGGVIVPPPTYYAKIQEVLRRYDVLVVADEVICGFGRTGHYWGSQAMGITPDILTCAKALSAAFLPISALMVNQRIIDAVAQETHAIGNFGHGYTYSGHPVPAAVALETLKIYDEMDIAAHASRIGAHMQKGLRERFGEHPLIGEVRGIGMLGAIEIVADKGSRTNFPAERKIGQSLIRFCEQEGIIVRACPNDAIALSPPLIMTEAETDELLDKLAGGLARLGQAIAGGEA